MSSRGLLVAGGLVVLALLLPPAQGHAYLEASNPPPNGDVPEGKTVLALRFTEVVEPDHTRVGVQGPDGEEVPAEIDVPSDRPRVVRVEVEPLAPGVYEMRWASFSVDSHVDQGTVSFTVGGATDPDPSPARPYDPGAQEPPLVALETGGRLAFAAGALVVFGLPVYLAEVDPREDLPEGGPPLAAAASVVGLAGVGVLLAVLVARLDVPPVEAALTLPGLFLLAKGILLILALGLARHAGGTEGPAARRRLLAATVPGLLALVFHSMSGHGVLEMSARESAAGHVAMTLHLAAGGLWLGGLAGLLLTAGDRHGLRERIGAFTPLAVVSVLALGVTGLIQAYVHLPTLAALWTSSFGQALLVKTGLLGIALAFGAWHGFGLPRRLADGTRGAGSFRRSGSAEVLAVTGVLLAAAAMGALPVPTEGLDLQDLPEAVFEEERTLPGHDVRLRLLDDPIRRGEPVPFELTVLPTSSDAGGETAADACAEGPGNRTVRLDLGSPRPAGPAGVASRWTDPNATFPEEGTWRLVLDLTLDGDEATLEVPVLVQARPGR